jgi:hypothetical protein
LLAQEFATVRNAIRRSSGLIQAQRVHQGVDLENQRVASSLQMVGVFEGKERGENMGGDSSTNAFCCMEI